MSKEPTSSAEGGPRKSEPPRYEAGRGTAQHSTAPDPRATATQSQNQNPKAQPGHSQKSQIAQYFRSQGKQPDDVILDIGGMKLTLKDLDG